MAGFVLLVVGWFGVSGEVYPAAQIPYIVSCGLGGLFLLTIGTTLWLSADLRDEWRELRRIRQELSDRRLAGEARADASGIEGMPAVNRNLSHRGATVASLPQAREA